MIDKFQALFKGSIKAHGSWEVIDLKNGRAKTIKRGPTIEDFTKHIDGRAGLGIVPIGPDYKCYFGAIDIDDHKKTKNTSIDHAKLAIKIATLGLPLIVCKSKSGGAHCYTFVKEPIPASEMITNLHKWGRTLGYKSIEIFPKQSELGEGQIGNWINLPYYGNERYGFSPSGNPLNLESFIKLAESMVEAKYEVKEQDEPRDFKDAPPCLEFIYKVGINDGERNTTLFNYGVYFKKAFPSDWKEKMRTLNYKAVSPPLVEKELNILIKSLEKTEYRYKCKEEPLCSVCDSTVCKSRAYGIDPDDDISGVEVMFGELTMIDMKPPKWILDISGHNVVLTTEELFSPKKVMYRCFEACRVVLDDISVKQWKLLITEKVKTVRIEEAPEDANEVGPVIDALLEYIEIGNNFDDRSMLHHGCTRAEIEGDWFIAFQVKSFEAFLKDKKINLKRNDLTMVLRNKNFRSHKVRIDKGTSVNCWIRETLPPEEKKDKKKIII